MLRWKVKSYKYLGHIITDNLSDNDVITAKRRILYARANMLLRQFHFCSLSVKCKLFNAYCRNIYMSSLWVNFTKSCFKSIQVAYNDAFRILLQLPSRCSASEMFATARVDSYKAFIRKCIFSFRQRILASVNSIVVSVTNSDIFNFSPICLHWTDVLSGRM